MNSRWSFKVCNLVDGDARAAYKTTDFDFRQFKNLKMFVHAEQSIAEPEPEIWRPYGLHPDRFRLYRELLRIRDPADLYALGVTSDQIPMPSGRNPTISILTLNRLVQVKYDRIACHAAAGEHAFSYRRPMWNMTARTRSRWWDRLPSAMCRPS